MKNGSGAGAVTAIGLVVVGYVVGWLAVVGLIAYVVIHFVSKFW